MKVLSFNMNGLIYLLGDDSMQVSTFESIEECERLFLTVQELEIDQAPLIKKTKEIFSAILGGDPKLHDIEDLEDLEDGDVVKSPTQAIAIADATDLSNVALSLFLCSGDKSKEWRDTGVKFDMGGTSSTQKESHGEFAAKVKKASPDAMYLSPRLLELEEWRFAKSSDSIH